MDAIALFFSKFSEELVGAEAALIFAVLALSVYFSLVRKKKRESDDWVPAALVRAYLDKVRTDEQDIRVRLFGQAAAGPAAAATTVTMVSDPNLAKELEALRAQLSLADQRAMDFDRNLNGLRAEKTSLEQRLKDALAAASAAPAAAGGGIPPGMQKELDDLKAKLQEYEVIEDDLANLKKFQKENEQLRTKIEQYEKGGAPAAAAPAPAPAAAPELKVVPNPAPAPAAAPTPAPAAAAPAAAPAAAAGDKPAKDKEAELLSEFEKMLAS